MVKVKIIRSEDKKKEITDFDKRVKVSDFLALNTSWTKDKYGNKDAQNLALFIELSDYQGRKRYWLISGNELENIVKATEGIQKYNMEHDNQGKEYHEKEREY